MEVRSIYISHRLNVLPIKASSVLYCLKMAQGRKQLEHVYAELVSKMKKNKMHRVRIPQLYNKDNNFSITGLSIVYFYMHLRKIVTKHDLTVFLRKYGCCKINPPNPRHLGMQYGFFFLVRDSYHPKYRRTLRPGEYSLYSIAKEHPSITEHGSTHRRIKLSSYEFNKLKLKYDCRCAVCGSKEGEANFKNKTVTTKLEKGHMNPAHELSASNCIPICTVCNQVYKNNYVFNSRGLIIKCTKKR